MGAATDGYSVIKMVCKPSFMQSEQITVPKVTSYLLPRRSPRVHRTAIFAAPGQPYCYPIVLDLGPRARGSPACV